MYFIKQFMLFTFLGLALSACGSGGGKEQNNGVPSKQGINSELPVTLKNGNVLSSDSTQEPVAVNSNIGKDQTQLNSSNGSGKEQNNDTAINQDTNGEQLNKDISSPEKNQESTTASSNSNIENDQTRFERLNRNGAYGGEIINSSLISLKLEGKEIALIPQKDNIKISEDSELITLRSIDGNLLGYYGYAKISEISKNDFGEFSAKHTYLPLFEIDPEVEKIRPAQNMTYQGKMFYHYLQIPEQSLEAGVTAVYQANTKRISVEISDTQGNLWNIRDGGRDGVEVSESGDVVGRLYTNKVPSGEFIGGIYGKNGELLVAKTKYEDHQDPQKSWKGVVGAIGK